MITATHPAECARTRASALTLAMPARKSNAYLLCLHPVTRLYAHTWHTVGPTKEPRMSEQEDEDFAQDTLIQAIENQLEAGEPAFVQAVLNKLSLVGYERDEIIELMALVLADEIDVMLRDDRPFDLARYEQGLRALPELPEQAP
jgi:hypothetical protein